MMLCIMKLSPYLQRFLLSRCSTETAKQSGTWMDIATSDIGRTTPADSVSIVMHRRSQVEGSLVKDIERSI